MILVLAATEQVWWEVFYSEAVRVDPFNPRSSSTFKKSLKICKRKKKFCNVSLNPEFRKIVLVLVSSEVVSSLPENGSTSFQRSHKKKEKENPVLSEDQKVELVIHECK